MMTLDLLHERIKALNNRIDKLSNNLEGSYIKLYKQILKLYLHVLQKYYLEYEVDGLLTFEEMSRYGRLDKLETDSIRISKDLYREIKKSLIVHLDEVYKESYYTTAWAIESESLVKLRYGSISAKTIQESIQNNFTYLKLNERLEKNRNEIILKLRDIITQELVKGSTYKTMSKRVQEVFEGDIVKAMRVVRTESGRLKEKAKLDSANVADDSGIVMEKTWRTLSDERVRDKHTSLDYITIHAKGVFEIDDDKAQAPKMFAKPENSINCRCFLTYSIKSIEPNKKQNDQLGNLSLDDWKESKSI
jgi:SPP1 gp7 family putative phage head morphogenesis protein